MWGEETLSGRRLYRSVLPSQCYPTDLHQILVKYANAWSKSVSLRGRNSSNAYRSIFGADNAASEGQIHSCVWYVLSVMFRLNFYMESYPFVVTSLRCLTTAIPLRCSIRPRLSGGRYYRIGVGSVFPKSFLCAVMRSGEV